MRSALWVLPFVLALEACQDPGIVRYDPYWSPPPCEPIGPTEVTSLGHERTACEGGGSRIQ